MTLKPADTTVGATQAQLAASKLYRGKSQRLIDAQLAQVEAGRDAAGRVGDR
ncbi:MAG: hypothetical protein LBK42_11245 [Propionibacteriaceae bacterium]|nr:hypothetical protein [Propionibacteriaceae bacterium]